MNSRVDVKGIGVGLDEPVTRLTELIKSPNEATIGVNEGFGEFLNLLSLTAIWGISLYFFNKSRNCSIYLVWWNVRLVQSISIFRRE